MSLKKSLSAVDWRNMLFLHLTLLLYSAVGIFAKLAAGAATRATALTFFALELAMLLVYTLLWQQVLRRMPLGFAYSNKGVCTLWTWLFGVLLFGENLTWGKAIGVIVVLVGVALVVTDHD